VDSTAPMACANRFGGPGTSRGGPRRGAMMRVASRPNGEKRGPEANRSRNPMASAQRSHSVRSATVRTDNTTTNPATTRAAYSFTGFGNVSSFLTTTLRNSVALRTIPTRRIAQEPVLPVSEASIRSNCRCSAAMSAWVASCSSGLSVRISCPPGSSLPVPTSPMFPVLQPNGVVEIGSPQAELA